jgi:Xaa-Pro aminopeptidase
MSAELSDRLGARLDAVRAHARAAGLDALLVTHLPNVRYLTGFSGTAGAAIVTMDRVVLVVDFRYATEAGALPGAGRLFDVRVSARSADEDTIAVLQALGSRRIGIESASMPVGRFNRLSAALATSRDADGDLTCPALAPTERIVEQVRVVKDAGEIATLREAAARLSGVARGVRRHVAAGRSEREIAADVDAAVRRAGFERAAFDTIVASGPNSALPHARPGARVVGAGEAVVLDFGGVYDGYCVDLTRTVWVGECTSDLRRLFVAVLEAHDAAVAAVRPGVAASEIDGAARATLARHGLAEAFGHGTGHGLGLEVHEEPRLSRAGLAHPDAALVPGMVFTIEPGAYVPGVGGVRIEDDVLVTESGADVLTDVPIEL